MKTLTELQRLFLSSPKFAVVGASKDTSKFGTKVLRWYQDRDMQVTPIHPKETELGSPSLPTIKSVVELESPATTSISVITPPFITLGILKSAKELGVPALWLQPGAEDAAVIDYIKEADMEDQVIYGGPCILVDGDRIKSML